MQKNTKTAPLYQCPFGLMLHFYSENGGYGYGSISVSMPFRAETPFLHDRKKQRKLKEAFGINALSGWCFISTGFQ